MMTRTTESLWERFAG